MKRVNILTIDTPTIDINVRLAECSEDEKRRLRVAMDRLGMQPGGKRPPLTDEEFSTLSQVLDGCPQRPSPGGSMANLFTTVSKLMRDGVHVDMLGVTAGEGPYTEIIRKSLKEGNVRLLPERLPLGSPSPMTATTFTIVDENGKKSSASYFGNLKDVLTPAVFQSEMFESNDILLLQGTNWFRLDKNLPDTIRSMGWGEKENWLALPTNSSLSEEEARRFKFLIPSTNVVLGNMGELHRVYRENGESLIEEVKLTDDDKHRALLRLQADFKKDFSDKHRMKQRPRRPQVGFITSSSGGSYVVTADEIKHIPVTKVVAKPLSDSGAGDTANAGFAFGYFHGLPYEECARIGNALAAAKLDCVEPRLPDPDRVIREQFPQRASLLGDRRGNGGAHR